jgi:hypothetical protein
MGYYERIRVSSSKTIKKGDGYEKIDLESEVFFGPGEVTFHVEGLQESFVSAAERLKVQNENKLLQWLSAPVLPTDFTPAAEIVKTEEAKVPYFDSERGVWNYCDKHPDEQVWYTSKTTHNKYQKCVTCNALLQRDGTRKPMGVKE